MKTQIQSLHFNVDDTLKNLIEKKTEKFFKLNNSIQSCNVILKLDKNNKNKNKIVEIILDVPGNNLFAKDQAETFEIALDLAVEELKRQIISSKEKDSELSRKNIAY